MRWAIVIGMLAASCLVHAQPPGKALFQEAAALERQGKGPEAVKVYIRAARSGNGTAARRLAEIYEQGISGVPRDYAESLKWYNAARRLGEDVPPAQSDDERLRREAEAAAARAARDAARRAEEAKRDEERRARIIPPVLRWETPTHAQLFGEATALEQAGKGPEAVTMYMRAARAGSAGAALRLSQIYDKGIPGVQRDYALSLKWGTAARVLGEDVPANR